MTQFLFTLLSVLALIFSACAPGNDSGVEKQNSSTVVGNPSSYTVFPDKIVYSAVTNKNVTIDAMSRFIVLGSNLSPSDVTVRIKRNAVLETVVSGKDLLEKDGSLAFSESITAEGGDTISLVIVVNGASPTLLSAEAGDEDLSPTMQTIPVWDYPESPINAQIDPSSMTLFFHDATETSPQTLEVVSNAPFSSNCGLDLNCINAFKYALVFQCSPRSNPNELVQWVIMRDESIVAIPSLSGSYTTSIDTTNAQGVIDFDGLDDLSSTLDDNYFIDMVPAPIDLDKRSPCLLTWLQISVDTETNRVIDQSHFLAKDGCRLNGVCDTDDIAP